MEQPQQPQQVDAVTIAKYLKQPKVVCVNPDCDCELFVPCAQIHKISKFVSVQGIDMYFPVQRSACLVCQTLLPLQP